MPLNKTNLTKPKLNYNYIEFKYIFTIIFSGLWPIVRQLGNIYWLKFRRFQWTYEFEDFNIELSNCFAVIGTWNKCLVKSSVNIEGSESCFLVLYLLCAAFCSHRWEKYLPFIHCVRWYYNNRAKTSVCRYSPNWFLSAKYD